MSTQCPARIPVMQAGNVFAGPYLERDSHLRDDAARFEEALASGSSRVVPVWNSRNLLAGGTADGAAAPHAVLLQVNQVYEPGCDRELMLLGRYRDMNVFACEIAAAEAPSLQADSRFEDLRHVAPLLSAEEAGLLGYARAMITWRSRHLYCGHCGTITVPAQSGHVRACTNPICRQQSFPRIDPAIIVLVSDEERALLGRQATWPQGRYSTIAGFVEPGESLEDAVVREVLEETGVAVDRIEYHSSQPWPFPSSLMLGFTAHALTREVQLLDRELEDARWFTREEIARGTPLLPPRQSISFRLIEHWFDARSDRALRALRTADP